MYTVIAYKEALEGNNLIRIYDDSTEKSFESKSDADEYFGYLNQNNVSAKKVNTGVDIYEKKVYLQGELDVNELKRQDALDKLTQEEKQLLNIQ